AGAGDIATGEESMIIVSNTDARLDVANTQHRQRDIRLKLESRVEAGLAAVAKRTGVVRSYQRQFIPRCVRDRRRQLHRDEAPYIVRRTSQLRYLQADVEPERKCAVEERIALQSVDRIETEIGLIERAHVVHRAEAEIGADAAPLRIDMAGRTPCTGQQCIAR